jgi:sulfatase modifying factor 1
LICVLAALMPLMSLSSLANESETQKIGFQKIDRTEVTIRQFTEFADQTGLKTEAEKPGGGFEWGFGWVRRPGWTFRKPIGVTPKSLDVPAMHITWQEASAYCNWVDGCLPTVQE